VPQTTVATAFEGLLWLAGASLGTAAAANLLLDYKNGGMDTSKPLRKSLPHMITERFRMKVFGKR